MPALIRALPASVAASEKRLKVLGPATALSPSNVKLISSVLKKPSKIVEPAPAKQAVPEKCSGALPVLPLRGTQLGSASVRGFPSASAFLMAAAGRQCIKWRLLSQPTATESPIANPISPNSLADSDNESSLSSARTIAIFIHSPGGRTLPLPPFQNMKCSSFSLSGKALFPSIFTSSNALAYSGLFNAGGPGLLYFTGSDMAKGFKSAY